MGTTIVACYSVWNEEERIGASIRSVEPYVDKILVVDGRYKGFCEGYSVGSTDLTLRIASKFDKVEVIECEEALPIYEKLNLFFTVSADWYFFICADGIMFGDLRKAFSTIRKRTDVKIWRVQVFTWLKDIIIQRLHVQPRIFSASSGFRYVKEHNFYKDQNGKHIASYAPILDDCWMVELNELCPVERQHRKRLWQTYQKQQGSWW